MTIKDSATVCTEIVEEFLLKKLVSEKKRDELIEKLRSGAMTAEEWTVLADLGTEESSYA